ncbi:hypothetical protein PVK06_043136 [Gossypium arboreum]|uniref:Uncharacterized protein n=1 Tax=Gossypium arboreum TaxID=29729 RepID=A0ABR0MN61_GOSAR|nr:hypothetical protein PVK06_043136 [Gossypium arboreum]
MKKAQEQQACYWSYMRDRDVALKRYLKNNFTKLMLDFLNFPKALLPFSKAKEEPVEIEYNKVESANMRATLDIVNVVEEEAEKTKSMNIESDEDE